MFKKSSELFYMYLYDVALALEDKTSITNKNREFDIRIVASVFYWQNIEPQAHS